MPKNAKVSSKTSSITRSAKNLPTSVDIAEDTKVGESDGGDDVMVEKSTLSKKQNEPARYLTSLCSGKDEFLLIVLAIVEALN